MQYKVQSDHLPIPIMHNKNKKIKIFVLKEKEFGKNHGYPLHFRAKSV